MTVALPGRDWFVAVEFSGQRLVFDRSIVTVTLPGQRQFCNRDIAWSDTGLRQCHCLVRDWFVTVAWPGERLVSDSGISWLDTGC